SGLRKLGAAGGNQLEFFIADANGKPHALRGPAPLRAGQWHHIAATWDFPKAHLQLFVDGQRVAADEPGPEPWPSSLAAKNDGKTSGIGIGENDQRSLFMQAFIGGDKSGSAAASAEAALDEFRISDVPRYADRFTPSRREFEVDEHTRALFHFENEADGVHDSDDRFVRGHLCVELPPQGESAALEALADGKVERRVAVVRPHATREQFEANRAESRLTVTRPFRQPPDPRFVEYRALQIVRTVATGDERFMLEVGGDYGPLMCSVTYQLAEPKTTRIPHWRANDNVVPLSVESLRATLGAKAATDAEKAFEGFKYALQVTNYFDAGYCETLPTRHRPRVSYTLLKALNIYPFDQCGPLNHTLRKLFLAVGISSNDASGTHHQFEQAFYQGRWRLFDLSPRLYWLNRDNATVVGRRGLEEDPHLKLRQGGDVCAWLRGRQGQPHFGTAERPHNMDFILRPGERVSLCWHNEGRWFEVVGNREPIPLAKIPPYFGNGAILFQPVADSEATALDNLALGPSQALQARDAAKPATLIYRAACPYIFSDAAITGQYASQGPGAVALSLSFDEGKTWTEVWRSPDRDGAMAVNVRDHVSGRYAYWLKLELAAAAATVKGFTVRTTFVASPLALPGKLKRGENRITFVGGPPSAPVTTTCRWIERHKSDLGVSLNALSYYMNGDEAHRNLFIVAPGRELPVKVTLTGRPLRGEARFDGLPDGWTCEPKAKAVQVADAAAGAEFVLRP
ncbi:MAG: LamG domain-containing protein, partial [Planctomycetes bacterium]|nr:LamG domain-containing protein [Planctomycetota bacterium]